MKKSSTLKKQNRFIFWKNVARRLQRELFARSLGTAQYMYSGRNKEGRAVGRALYNKFRPAYKYKKKPDVIRSDPLRKYRNYGSAKRVRFGSAVK